MLSKHERQCVVMRLVTEVEKCVVMGLVTELEQKTIYFQQHLNYSTPIRQPMQLEAQESSKGCCTLTLSPHRGPWHGSLHLPSHFLGSNSAFSQYSH